MSHGNQVNYGSKIILRALTGVLGFKLNNEDAHIFARQSADNIDKNGNVLDVSKPFLLQPGSKEFLETNQSLINLSLIHI